MPVPVVIRTSESLAALAAALVAAQAAMPNVPKETMGQVGNQRRPYTDLATITETVRPILASHKLAFVQSCSDGAGGYVTVTTRLLHASGEWLEDSLSMPTGNGSAQSVGSATTYARRYSLMAVLGLASDDDDGDAASQPARRRQTPARATQPPPDTDDAPTLSEPQMRKLRALYGAVGVKGAAEQKQATGVILGRQIDTHATLTPDEARHVIDVLSEVEAGVLRIHWGAAGVIEGFASTTGEQEG